MNPRCLCMPTAVLALTVMLPATSPAQGGGGLIRGFVPLVLNDLRAAGGESVSNISAFPQERTVQSSSTASVPRYQPRSFSSTSIEGFTQLPLTTTADILQLRTNSVVVANGLSGWIPGFRDRGFEQVHMRGGRHGEVAFLIDGLQVTNPVYGGQAATVTPYSLSEMVIMTGGMSAEYGNVMSGVVNMVTREGARRMEGSVEVESSEFTGRPEDDLRDLTRVKGFLGGPVLRNRKMSFFLSGYASTSRDYLTRKDDIVYDTTPESSPDKPGIDYQTDAYIQTGPDGRPIWPYDLLSGWVAYGFNNEWNAMGNLTYRVTPSQKLTLSAHRSYIRRAPYDFEHRYSMLLGLPSWFQEACTLGIPREDGDITTNAGLIDSTGLIEFENEHNIHTGDNNRLAFIWTHQIGRTFYSIRGSYFSYKRRMRVERWVNADGYHSARRFYYDRLEQGDNPLWSPDDGMTLVTLEPIPYNDVDQYNLRFGYAPSVISAAGLSGSDVAWANQFDITRTLKGDITSQLTTHHQVKAGFQFNSLSLDLHEIENPADPDASLTRFGKGPRELALYVQDKVEHDMIILNLGLRYDWAFVGDTRWWSDPYDPTTGSLISHETITDPFGDGFRPRESEKILSTVSPRVGVSHPTSERSVLYFNYGHFYQNPHYRYMFYGMGEGGLLGPSLLIGNPRMKPEKTVQYEMGFKNQFTEIMAVEVAVWSRYSSNLIGVEDVPAFYLGIDNPYPYSVFLNRDTARASGFDLVLTRRYSGFIGGKLRYSFIRTEVNYDYPMEAYYLGESAGPVPMRTTSFGWERPHQFSAAVHMIIPRGGGPEFLGVHPLERMQASVTYHASSGWPYTPFTGDGGQFLKNSERMPWSFQCDLKVYRDFEVSGILLGIFCDVRNVFDRRNILAVYSETGKADDPGSDLASYSDYYDRYHYYSAPRRINLGVRIYLR